MKKLSIALGLFLSFFVVGSSLAVGSFTDVSSGTQYGDAIRSIAADGIVQGYSDGTFRPRSNLNRAEFTKIIIEAKYPGEAGGSDCFSDVQFEWFADYVCYAKTKGIVGGNPDGTFRPGDDINTAEAYKIISETFLHSPNYNPSGAWYEKYLEYARTADLGYDRVLDPNHLMTRGEMAQTIFNYLEYSGLDEDEADIYYEPGIYTDTIQASGEERNFKYYIPETLSEDASLVFIFHGSMSLSKDPNREELPGPTVTKDKVFNKIADTENIIVVYPTGSLGVKTIGWTHTESELLFFDELLVYFQDKFTTLDPKRVYVSGHSSGAIFSFVLAGYRVQLQFRFQDNTV